MKTLIRMLVVLSATPGAGCDSQQPQVLAATAPYAPQAIATTREIMLGITAPTSDFIFQLGMQEPTTDAEWEKVVANAVSLAESANLLMVPPRLIDRQQWLQDSKDLIAAAKLAETAARNKNMDGVSEAAGPIYQTCVACHKKYGPTSPGQDTPAG